MRVVPATVPTKGIIVGTVVLTTKLLDLESAGEILSVVTSVGCVVALYIADVIVDTVRPVGQHGTRRSVQTGEPIRITLLSVDQKQVRITIRQVSDICTRGIRVIHPLTQEVRGIASVAHTPGSVHEN